MPKVLVLDHSAYGPIDAMAQAAVDLVQPPPHNGAFARRTAHMLDMMNIALQVLRKSADHNSSRPRDHTSRITARGCEKL